MASSRYDYLMQDQTQSPNLVAIRGREQQSGPEPGIGSYSMCSLDYWQPYFTIQSEDIKRRLIYSLSPQRTSTFIEEINCRPDLYGPVWISGALIFFSVICSTADIIFTRMFFKEEKNTYVIDYEVLGFICAIVYGFLFGFSLIATVWLKFMGIETSIVKVAILLTRILESTDTL